MRIWVRLCAVFATLFRGRRRDQDLDDELQAYVETMVERRIADGAPSEDARRVVLVDMGGVEQVKERVREVRVGRWLDETWRDVTHACRGLRRSPAFTAAALATLALGVSANTAIFSGAYALLIQPLPFRNPDRLVVVWTDQTAEGYPRAPLSGPELRDLDERAARFDGFGAIWATTAALTGGDRPEQLRIGFVTTDFFSVLGADAALGRTFTDEDNAAGPPTAIVLSADVWQRRYGSDPNIVGARVEVNDELVTVIGVMPVGFRLLMPPDGSVPDDLEAWLPFNRRFVEGPRGQRYLRIVGRMRNCVSLADARADVDRVGREISAANASYGASGRRFDVQPLQADSTRDIRLPLLVLVAGVSILLLMACVNVGSLLVARAAVRSCEFAVKSALGAGLGRLVRQHLAESLVLGVLGSGLGIALGVGGLRALLALTPPSLARMQMATVNLAVVAVSVATVLGWMALLAVAPLRETLRAGAAPALHGDGRQTAGPSGRRLRHVLTVMQVALSVVLVVSALLLVRTVQRVNQIRPGFTADGVLSFRLALPRSRYPDQAAFNAFSRHLQDTLGGVPGARGAAAISHAPYDHVPNWGGPYLTERGADPSTAPQADYRAVSPGAMELLEVSLVDGRFFAEEDDVRHAPVVIIDESLAQREWPREGAVGKALGVDPDVRGTPSTWATVVGVVRHVRHRSPVQEVRPQVYFPLRQVVRNPSVYLVKTDGDPATLAPSARERLRALDAALPIYDVRPLSAYVDDARALRRFTTLLAVLFAVVAILLAAVGVYGLIAYLVTRRAREFAVRMALGARGVDVMRLVCRNGAVLVMTGTGLGLLLAAGGARWLRQELYGVTPWDPVALGVTIGIFVVVAVVASVWPARRATRSNPVIALRAD